MTSKHLFGQLILLLLGVFQSTAMAKLEPADLKCEFGTNPAGIDVAQPRLFWRVTSNERGQRQTAWQVLVASSADALSNEKGDLWDSGRVGSDQTAFVRYNGAKLVSSQQVFWRVRVWDREGNPSAWSPPASWTMGVLAADDWKGSWIGAEGRPDSLMLRHEFTVSPRLKRAVLHVSGLGSYEAELNGAKIGQDLLSPGWTDFSDTVLYDTYDVTTLLKSGPNAMGLILGNGMYHVVRPPGRFAKFTGSYGTLRAIAHLRLEYADGSVQFVGTDESWRTNSGPVTFNSIYGGEDFDARLMPAAWSGAGFDASGWQKAVKATAPIGALRGHSAAAEPVRAIETRKPAGSKAFPDGTTVYDFGQNTSFMPRLTVTGPAGSTVRLTPAEVVNADGTIYRATMGSASRGSSWWKYTKSTSAPETWFPRFYYLGSRYVRAELLPPDTDTLPAAGSVEAAKLPKIESLEAVVVHSTAAPAGKFATSSELLNRTRDLVRWAQRSNMVSILTDCPHREKLGWLEQTHLNGPAVRYEWDAARIYTKVMNDVADAQLPTGQQPNIAPEYVRFNGSFRSAAEWGAAGIMIPWQQYEFLADADLLRAHYDRMKRNFAYLQTRAVDDIVSDGLGDWYEMNETKRKEPILTLPPLTCTAHYFQDAWVLARAAEVLGKPDEAKTFTAHAERIRQSFNKKFFDAAAGCYSATSQAANGIPLAMGIVEPAERQRMLDALVRTVEQADFALTCGGVGTRYVLNALGEGGRSDVVFRVLQQDAHPGYAYVLKSGATSLTEAWDARRNASHNHFMLGQITEWFYRHLAGIDVDPAGPGFKKIIIRPNPVGDLTWVEASYDSIHGPIAVRWERLGERLVLKTTIPANTTATVYLPTREGATLTEGGSPVEQSSGVKFLRREGDRAVYAVESGSYSFESR